MPTEPLPPVGGVSVGAFAGRDAFRDHLRAALSQAAEQRWPELVLADPDFDDWPLGEESVADALNAWAAHGQQLRVLAARFEPLQRRHDRFVTFRRQWSHKVECRVAASSDVPSLLLAPRWLVQRLDVERCTGLGSGDAGRVVRANELFTERWQRARPGFFSSVLGL